MPHSDHGSDNVTNGGIDKRALERQYARQAERLGRLRPSQENIDTGNTQAAEAHFVTAHDPVVVTATGERLPVAPIDEALKLNQRGAYRRSAEAESAER